MPTWSCKQLNAELPACAYQGASLGSTPGPPTCRLYKQAAGLWQHKPSCSKLLLRPHPAKMRLVLQNSLCSRALLSCAAGKGKSLLMPGTQTQLKSKQPEIKHENSLTLSLFGTFLLSPSKTPGTKSTAQRSHSWVQHGQLCTQNAPGGCHPSSANIMRNLLSCCMGKPAEAGLGTLLQLLCLWATEEICSAK